MDRKLTNIKIITEFGSDFQKELADKSLLIMLSAWKETYNNTHKKNIIKVEIDNKPI